MYSEPATDFPTLKKLPQNGTIAITAPASPVDQQKLERGINYLEKLGYRTKIGDSCSASDHYVAGSDESRAYEIMDFLDDPDVDAIFCARGGYGSMRLLKLLDFQLFLEQRKPFVGFSDITALQWAIYSQSGCPTISAGMVATDMASLPLNETFEEQFWQLLEHGTVNYQLDHEQEEAVETEGLCLAGTTSVGAKLLGTSYFPNPKNAILVLEDVDEQSHKIEGYLLQFNLARIFDKASAVILGTFRKANTEQYPDVPSLDDIFDRAFQGVRTPWIRNLPYGHIPEKIPLPIGAPVSLSLGSKSSLRTKASIYEQ